MFSTAFAADLATQQVSGSTWFFSIYMVVFFAIAYFLFIRPKQQKENQQRSLLNNIKVGDEIVTNSGIMGKIEKIVDHYILLAIHDDVKLKIQKQYISNVLPKGTLKAI